MPDLSLPKILIIDDQFGRYRLKNYLPKDFPVKEIQKIIEDRNHLCDNLGVCDISDTLLNEKVGEAYTAVKDPTANAAFCPGQIFDGESWLNDYDSIEETVKKGWPFEDGSRWALVLLDISFSEDTLDSISDALPPAKVTNFGFDILKSLKKGFSGELPILILSGTEKVVNNKNARQLGALDYIEREKLVADDLKKKLFHNGLLEDRSGFVIGRSLSILKCLREIRRKVDRSRILLLTGESGSGKTLFAQYYHSVSNRRDRELVRYRVNTTPDTLVDDELFGHERNAYIGAKERTPGKFEEADGGILFIDEIGNLSADVQNKLLTVTEDFTIERIGAGAKPVKVDVSVICATNKNLESKEFANDLFHRISTHTIKMPTLADRIDDIPLLVNALKRSLAKDLTLPEPEILPEAVLKMSNHKWRKNNVRELKSVLERAIVETQGEVVTEENIHIYYGDISEDQLIEDHDSLGSKSKGHDTDKNELINLILELISIDTEELTLNKRKEIENRFPGAFQKLLASILAFAFKFTKDYDKLNLVQSMKFLLGDDTLTPLQAKARLKAILTIDQKQGSVWKEFEKFSINHEPVQRVIRECRDQFEAKGM